MSIYVYFTDILVSQAGTLKLGDFGLARIFSPSYNPDNNSNNNNSNDNSSSNPTGQKRRPYSHQVATRWYRAPELLYASRSYDAAVDVWSIGVILAELLLLRPLFPGSSDIDQMSKVFQIMGSPDAVEWEVQINCFWFLYNTNYLIIYKNAFIFCMP